MRETILTDGQPVPDNRSHTEIDPATGMQKGYVVLKDRDPQVRPIRYEYTHKKCGAVTRMGQALAETYATDPTFYTGTYCIGCRTHFPVAEFVWKDTNIQVGT